uniref:HTH_Tnp_ISL3 domain-containing protein n=1 Tax=Macrostomum lignano TaxID=282301 RepID=A0A1I8FEV4_9PLAT
MKSRNLASQIAALAPDRRNSLPRPEQFKSGRYFYYRLARNPLWNRVRRLRAGCTQKATPVRFNVVSSAATACLPRGAGAADLFLIRTLLRTSGLLKKFTRRFHLTEASGLNRSPINKELNAIQEDGGEMFFGRLRGVQADLARTSVLQNAGEMGWKEAKAWARRVRASRRRWASRRQTRQAPASAFMSSSAHCRAH